MILVQVTKQFGPGQHVGILLFDTMSFSLWIYMQHLKALDLETKTFGHLVSLPDIPRK